MFKSKKIISVLIITFVLCSLFSLVVAAEGEENLVSGNLNSWNYDTSSDMNPTITYTDGENKINFSFVSNKVFASYFTVPYSFTFSHSYTLSFSASKQFNYFHLDIYLQNGTDEVSRYLLGSVTSNLTSYTDFSFTFTPNSIFENVSELRIYFVFTNATNRSGYSLFIDDLMLVDNSPPTPAVDSVASAFTNYIIPTQNFLISSVFDLFSRIESQWYLLLAWYLVNSALIIISVIYAIYDWTEIISDDTLELGLRMVRKDRREQLYNERKEANRKESEERYRIRQAERESEIEKKAKKREEERQIAKQNREKENQALTHYIGGSGKYSNKELAEGYFKRFPNRYSVTIGGHKYFNLALLEKAKRDTDDKKS